MGGVNQKESREDIILNIYRDTGEGNFLNRVCKDKSTGVRSPLAMKLTSLVDSILLFRR